MEAARPDGLGTAQGATALKLGLLVNGAVVFVTGLALVAGPAKAFYLGFAALGLGAGLILFGGSIATTHNAVWDGPAVALEARLDEPLSRWLWLVKWLLIIPHAIVLGLLAAAFAVLTLAAWVAILATEKYPRAIFETNLGILRYAWRVSYYGYGVLATDRYPPWTLDDVPFPARLYVAYPERLSRGKALVKFWVLALPHYLIFSALCGGPKGNLSFPALLVLFAAVALTVTGRYPRGIFDIVLGFARWAYRVVVYAALMRDEYPPFRLDLGPDEPATSRRLPAPVAEAIRQRPEAAGS